MMRVVFLSDFDPIGSGYQNLSTMICQGLSEVGCEVKALGLHYGGQEHKFDFSIVPIGSLPEAFVAIHNLNALWKFDVLIVALDINLQRYVMDGLQQYRSFFKYIGIMPIESDPLCDSWAMVLLQMDLPFIISKFGTEEAHKAGVLAAQYLELGVSDVWKSPVTQMERDKYRLGLLGIEDLETFVYLTVADNQERKNLSASLEAYTNVVREYPNTKYVLVTRERNPVGWALRDLITEFGIQNNVILLERGMPVQDLRGVVAASDCFVIPSKAEGLCLPLLEAMAMKLPCIGTDCTGIKELLGEGRGHLIPPQMIHRDCFGNGKRYWIDILNLEWAMREAYEGRRYDIEAGYNMVKQMKWENTVKKVFDGVTRLINKTGEENE